MSYLRLVDVIDEPGPLILGVSFFAGVAAIPAALVSLPRRVAFLAVFFILICISLAFLIDRPFYWIA